MFGLVKGILFVLVINFPIHISPALQVRYFLI